MRYILLLLMLGFFHVQAQQKDTEKLIKQGQALFGHELYEDAINKYKQAIAFDKKCMEAAYELAYTYLHTNNYDEALHYSRQVLAEEDDFWLDALLVYGAVLTHKGNPKQAIRAYRKALKNYPDEYLLHYNMAESYERLDEWDKAEVAAIRCLQMNRNHRPSHLLLSSINQHHGHLLKSMLPLYYCLFIEVDEDEKAALMRDLEGLWQVALTQRVVTPKKLSKHSHYSGLDLAEAQLHVIARKSADEVDEALLLPVQRSMDLLALLDEVQTGEMDFFDIQYVDLLVRLYRAGHAEAFSYYICSAAYKDEVLLWLGENQAAFDAFVRWMTLQEYIN
ncbi:MULTISPECIES: tetratricopeptide repeat protein [unclassified Carboxylicivirga]|uniref:tetratricopeptide repeat protein n=1 Tax=Carboxylicivirga TaxID=1628153 RepID=UPI003D3260CF